MKIGNLKTISQYSTLIQNLNPLGKYQLRLYIICVLYWMIAGMYTTCFDLNFQQFKCIYSIGGFQCLGLLLLTWISNIKGRRVGIFIASIFACIGFILCLIHVLMHPSNHNNGLVGTFGIALISLSVYAQPCLILCIVCQITTKRIIQIILCLCLTFYCIGRMFIIPIIQLIRQIKSQQQLQQQAKQSDYYTILLIIAPVCMIALALTTFIHDSPRYFIQNNINKAEQLIKKIALFNTGKQIQVTSIIDQNFFVKRIHLRKYNYWTLTKYQSFGFNQYCTWVVMVLLGIVGRQAKYIFQVHSVNPPQTQIYWISCFEIIGIVATVFFIKLWYRRFTCVFNSLAIAIVATILYCLEDNQIYTSFVLLGLNAVCSIVMFSFLMINCIQFYPHSIRGLGVGLMLTLYYMGQLMFNLYQNLATIKQRQCFQLFMTGAWIMTVHCLGIQETLDKGLSYEIREIQQEENQQQI